MALVEERGYRCTHDSKRPQGEIAVINTCGFIGDAKEESINTILEFAQRKKEGRLQRLYVMGCLSERYLADLQIELPEVDKFYGKFDFRGLVDELSRREERGERRENSLESRSEKRGKATGRRPTVGNERSENSLVGGEVGNLSPLSSLLSPRKLTTPRHYAYLKISEGCDRHCAYCAIPIITGKHVSRPQEEILEEVRWLVSQGVNELQVIAQELTYYGVDLDGRQQIAELIERIADVPGIKWIRLHYAYPTHFPWDLLRVMRERPNVCRYMDIALQHISDPILKAMHRNVTKAETYDLIRRMRQEVPGIHLRTTLMVGFPGETDADFQELIDFVRWARFERMGAFAYSEEEGTYSALHYEDNIPDEVKQDRLSRLMAIQQEISAEIEAEKVGQTLRVVIDRKEGDYYVGRSEFCSPEVDPEVLIPAAERRLRVGCMYDALITGAEEFDVYGQVR